MKLPFARTSTQWLALSAIIALSLLPGFTGSASANPDIDPSNYVENPYQPHKTTGSMARLGSVVSHLY